MHAMAFVAIMPMHVIYLSMVFMAVADRQNLEPQMNPWWHHKLYPEAVEEFAKVTDRG